MTIKHSHKWKGEKRMSKDESKPIEYCENCGHIFTREEMVNRLFIECYKTEEDYLNRKLLILCEKCDKEYRSQRYFRIIDKSSKQSGDT